MTAVPAAHAGTSNGSSTVGPSLPVVDPTSPTRSTPTPAAPGGGARNNTRDDTRDDIGALAGDAIAGDAGAVDALIRAIRPRVVRYCRVRLKPEFGGGHDLADDVAQEVCVAVVSALPRYRDMGRPFLAFVHGIAAHKVADARRRRTAAPHLVGGVSVFDRVEEVPEPGERVAGAQQARELVEQLPDQQREVVLLRVVAGYSAQETASALNVSPGAVRVQQHRALARLRVLAEQTGIQ